MADGAARFHDVLVIAQRDSLHIGRSLEGGEQLGHVQGVAFIHGTTSPRRRGALLAEERRGRHLATGHSVNGVVHEEHRDLLATVCGMHDFSRADGGEVAVALIGNDNFFRTGALYSSSAGRRAPVGGLHIAHIEVVIREHRATHRADEDGAILQTQVFDGLRDQLVRHSVAAAGTVVSLVLELGFAFVGIVEHRRFRVHRLVASWNLCFFHHCFRIL